MTVINHSHVCMCVSARALSWAFHVFQKNPIIFRDAGPASFACYLEEYVSVRSIPEIIHVPIN